MHRELFQLVSRIMMCLCFSYVGYDPQEIAAGNKTEINVSLAAAKTNLEQVVVIGYGTASKRDLTGSIAKVSGKEVAISPIVILYLHYRGKFQVYMWWIMEHLVNNRIYVSVAR